MRNFFGLTNEYQQDVYEQIFSLKYHGGWSVMEVYNLPVQLRTWFVQRLVKQLNDESEQIKKASKK
jgi:hypothetical protein